MIAFHHLDRQRPKKELEEMDENDKINKESVRLILQFFIQKREAKKFFLMC